jgi:diguanylate cyclase (GGDEF)-like protein
MAALCLFAAGMTLRRVIEKNAPAMRPRRLLWLVMAVLLLGAAEAGLDAWWHLVRRADQPIPAPSWFWLAFDFAVPLLGLSLLRVMRQRDLTLEQLSALSMTDALTGLANRRGFEMRARAAVEAAEAAGRPCCVLLLDLDRFKAINDAHGHPAGDAVLREVADTLARGVRAEDVLGRLGGEEFVVLAPGSTVREAVPLAERLRGAVRARVGHPGGRGEAVTLSAGIATLVPAGSSAAALTVALAAADEALYAAKAGGRDRVEVAPRTREGRRRDDKPPRPVA